MASDLKSWGKKYTRTTLMKLTEQRKLVTMQTVDAKDWKKYLASVIRADFPFPANLGTLLLLMTFLGPCPGLRDIVFGSS